jgi:hypothetical protein
MKLDHRAEQKSCGKRGVKGRIQLETKSKNNRGISQVSQ